MSESAIIRCWRCHKDKREHATYKVRCLVTKNGVTYKYYEMDLVDICTDAEAQETVHLTARQLKFECKLELLKFVPDQKSEGGIILLH